MRRSELVVVGGGAAGLAAAFQASREGVDVLLLEEMGTGGQLVNVHWVENFPGIPDGVAGYELAPLLTRQAADAGVSIEYRRVVGLRVSGEDRIVELDGGDAVAARAVILASGSRPARLNVPGEQEHEGRGVSYCALCDAEFFRGLPVAVVGGGDAAVDEALYLAGVCDEVTVLYRGSELRAQRVLQERARRHPRVRLCGRTVVEAIEGDRQVRCLLLRDASSGEQRRLAVGGVFVAVGLDPRTEYVREVLPLDAGGHVPVDLWMRTPVPGVFAAGDLRQSSARLFASSAGDGVTAARAAVRYLRGLDGW